MAFGVAEDHIVHRGMDTLLLKEVDDQNREIRLYKVLRESNPSEQTLQKLVHEYEITQSLSGQGFRKVLDKTFFKHHQALVMEYLPGHSLHTWLKALHSEEERITIAINLARIVGEMHQQHILHNALSPHHIMVDHDTLNLHLIDFGQATALSMQGQPTHSVLGHTGEVHYLSPEQTGRVNRSVDHRSDLYALGAILYELFSGSPPFAGLEDSEVIHAHLARSPKPLREVVAHIPVPLEQIILRLLAKNAQERYHSAVGVMADLQQVQGLSEEAREEPMTLGALDYSGRLYPMQHLYGREAELHQLFELYKVVKEGNSKLVWITGYSGAGKSSLIAQLKTKVVSQRAFFATGKFQQDRQLNPYTGITEAIEDLIEHNLKPLPEVSRERILVELRHQLGANARVLTDLVPTLAEWMGNMPELPKMKGKEEQFRLEIAFQNLFRALASPRNPVVLYLDDMQWADAPSIQLMQSLVEDATLTHVMLVGCYRSNEVEQNQAMMKWLDHLKQKEVGTEIRVGNLGYGDIHAMLQDVLHTQQPNLDELTSLILSKTKGNPFFTYQLVRSLYEDGHLTYAVDVRSWVWDVVSIGQLAVTGNVVDLMTQQISRLGTELIEVLAMGGIIGFRFSAQLLADSLGRSRDTLDHALGKLTREGWLIRDGQEYHFGHDRFHQAILAYLPEATIHEYHYRLTQTLLGSLTPEEQEEHIFELVRHANMGGQHAKNESFENRLRQLNFKAAERAFISAAFKEAMGYLQTCLAELPPNAWQVLPQETLAIYQKLAEAALQAGEMDVSDQQIDILLEQAQSPEEILYAQELRLQTLIYREHYQEAMTWGLNLLRSLGLSVPQSMTKRSARKYLSRTKKRLKGMQQQDWYNLPALEDPKWLAITRIGFDLSLPAFFANPHYVIYLGDLLIQCLVEHGITAWSVYGLVQYAFVISVQEEEIEEGIQYGTLAVELAKAKQLVEILPRAIYTKNVFLSHWRETYPETVLEMEYGLQVALNTGNYEMASNLVHNMINQTYYAGIPLPELRRYSDSLNKQVMRFRNDNVMLRLQSYRQGFVNLQERAKPLDALTGELFDENAAMRSEEARNPIFQINVLLNKLHLAVYYQRYEQAYSHAQACLPLFELGKGALTYSMFQFHYALALAGWMRQTGVTTVGLAKLKELLKTLQGYAERGPIAFSQKALAVEAEYAALRQQHRRARDCYSVALKESVKHGRMNDEALIWELTGMYYGRVGDEILANFHLENAFRIYRRWGATGKIDQLAEDNPGLFGKLRRRERQSRSQDLDLAAVLKASAILSSEIQLSKLLETLVGILLENAGADRGVFVLEQDGKWSIMASGTTQQGIVAQQRISVAGSGLVPESIIETVKLMGKPVIIDDAQLSNPYGADPFFRQDPPRSVLCLPVQAQGRMLGIVYLSNALTSGIFTEQRLGLLEMLSGQIGISVENAIMYEDLDRKVQQRTEELKLTLEELKNKNALVEARNQEVQSSIQYGKTIQQAMMPEPQELKRLLTESFVFFRPRDMVSGDFYWWAETEDYAVVAVVDCTGHGVPGAFMSMIGIQLLENIVKTRGITAPEEVLQHLQQGVYEALHQEEQVIHDGMDLGIVRLHKGSTMLDFAGAKNSMVYIDRQGIHRVRGEHVSLSGAQAAQRLRFQRHTLTLEPGTMVYLYSDGFQDQFGGLHDKKFKSVPFRELLSEISFLPPAEQAQEMHETLTAWKGDRDQTDDILVIGFRV